MCSTLCFSKQRLSGSYVDHGSTSQTVSVTTKNRTKHLRWAYWPPDGRRACFVMRPVPERVQIQSVFKVLKKKSVGLRTRITESPLVNLDNSGELCSKDSGPEAMTRASGRRPLSSPITQIPGRPFSSRLVGPRRFQHSVCFFKMFFEVEEVPRHSMNELLYACDL